jgi:hypothetical protein
MPGKELHKQRQRKIKCSVNSGTTCTLLILHKKILSFLGVLFHACHPSTQEVRAGGE